MSGEIIKTTETDAEWAEGQLNRFRKRFDPVLAAFLTKETEAATGSVIVPNEVLDKLLSDKRIDAKEK